MLCVSVVTVCQITFYYMSSNLPLSKLQALEVAQKPCRGNLSKLNVWKESKRPISNSKPSNLKTKIIRKGFGRNRMHVRV